MDEGEREIVEQLDTPTGVYSIDSLTKLVYGIRRALGLPVLDYEDLLHDIVVYLLEGKSLSQACLSIRTKYKSWKRGVAYHLVPEMVIYEEHNRGNRLLTKKEKEELRDRFYALVDSLPKEDQNIVLLRTFGLKHKDIGSSLGLSEVATRKRLQRIVEKLKSQ